MEIRLGEVRQEGGKVTRKSLVVGEEGKGVRAYKYLATHARDVLHSHAQLQRAFAERQVWVNDTSCKSSRILALGDMLSVDVDEEQLLAERHKQAIDGLWQDAYVVVVGKPAGVGVSKVREAVRFFCGDVVMINGVDKAASGIVLTAKTKEARDDLIREGRIQMDYVALCFGDVQDVVLEDTQPTAWSVESLALARACHLASIRRLQLTRSNAGDGYLSTVSIQCRCPHTGVVIRKLMDSLAHPIVGQSDHTRTLRSNKKGLCLSMTCLAFQHPVSHTWKKMTRPEPDKIINVREREERFWQKRQNDIAQEWLTGDLADYDPNGQPLAYVCGTKTFCGLVFKVTPDCLIPRASTETLVQAAFQSIPDVDTLCILDIGTGCGNILLALLHRLHLQHPTLSARGTGIDLSKKALTVAQHNAEQLGLTATFLPLDFAHLDELTGPFHLVVCNPPYLSSRDMALYQRLQYEPQMALHGSGDGYESYRVIAASLKRCRDNGTLRPGALLCFEMGKDMKAGVLALWEDWCTLLGVERDAQGWERCLVLQVV